jgi:hypothetical protein
MIRLTVLLLPCLTLLQCAPPPPPTGQARADAATVAACREHADEVYNRTRRDSIYTITNPDIPFSANYNPVVTNRGLAQRYVQENMVRDCVRNTGTETDRSPTTSPPPATP